MNDPREWINLNGLMLPAGEARVGVLDHGLLYGDGLFETLRVYGGRFFRLDAHLARLETGARQFDLPLPWPLRTLEEALGQTAAANGMADGIVRLTLTRGEGPPVPDPAACGSPAFFVTARRALRAGGSYERGLSVTTDGIHPRLFMPAVKTLCYAPFQHARLAAKRLGFDDSLLCDGENVIEASAGNVFAVRGTELVTPNLESGCLAGITRAVVLDLATECGLAVRETAIPRSRLGGADEVFLTNSVIEIIPVTRVDGAAIANGAPGPRTRHLLAAYRALVARETGA